MTEQIVAPEKAVAIVGLGYVGLPLAAALGVHVRTIGIDLSVEKIENYRRGHDPSGEVSREALLAAEKLEFTTDAAAIAEASFVIVVVPTPIDDAKGADVVDVDGPVQQRAVDARLCGGGAGAGRGLWRALKAL